MSTERRRWLKLALWTTGFTAAVAALVALIASASLYRVALEDERGRLAELALSQARLTETVAASEMAGGGTAESSTASVLEYVATAHAQYDPAARSGELQIAQESGDRIVFLIDQGRGGCDVPNVTCIAADAMERGGRTWIRIAVENNGIGIPEENIRRVFDPFFTTKPRDRGTGPGLSISYGIVREHQGTLYAESAAGELPRFVVGLPAADSARDGADADDDRR